MSGGDHADLPPGTYYFSKFTLSGGSWVVISGPTKIYTTSDFTLSGGSLANTTQIPANLQIYPMGAKCVISGGSDLYAVVFAPTAKVERSGESHYFGSIVGYELVLSGSGGVHADRHLIRTWWAEGPPARSSSNDRLSARNQVTGQACIDIEHGSRLVSW